MGHFTETTWSDTTVVSGAVIPVRDGEMVSGAGSGDDMVTEVDEGDEEDTRLDGDEVDADAIMDAISAEDGGGRKTRGFRIGIRASIRARVFNESGGRKCTDSPKFVTLSLLTSSYDMF